MENKTLHKKSIAFLASRIAIVLFVSFILTTLSWFVLRPAVTNAYVYYGYQYEYQYQYQYEYQYQTPALTITTAATAKSTLSITGNLVKGSGSFLIDHPLDPANKLLYHSFVESPDVKNIYDGVATLDKNGEAMIQLPSYFEALNKDFRYQIKPISAAMPGLYVKSEVKDNQFTVSGGLAGAKISWQVTGIRHDPYILAHPIIPEVDKTDTTPVKKGEYLFEGYGKESFLGPLSRFFERLWVSW